MRKYDIMDTIVNVAMVVTIILSAIVITIVSCGGNTSAASKEDSSVAFCKPASTTKHAYERAEYESIRMAAAWEGLE